MPAPASSTDQVQFGVFELDLQRAELRKNGVKVKLQEQPLKVLHVSREDLRQRIWPANTFVEFDQGLYSAMARLRDAQGTRRRVRGLSRLWREGDTVQSS